MVDLETERQVRKIYYEEMLREAEKERLYRLAQPRERQRQMNGTLARLRCSLPILSAARSCTYASTAL